MDDLKYNGFFPGDSYTFPCNTTMSPKDELPYIVQHLSPLSTFVLSFLSAMSPIINITCGRALQMLYDSFLVGNIKL